MARFVTFYSYKGGVGRTLALANVAWLLANHADEPARVLTVDFDLGAPGLHQVLGMGGARSKPGVVDYVLKFVETAQVPSIKDYVHKTRCIGVDLIPSGRLDRNYQARLETIDWAALYSSAHGYDLFERLKRDINGLVPSYDYVLIDSLTGYSDVGGVCVDQLSDSAVLLFRLNRQNLDGIGNVFRGLQAPKHSEAKHVIPVVTPSWPFIDETAATWIKKAQAVFSGQPLLEISFDSGLSFGERIISRSASKLPLSSKVLADYRVLTSSIREQNASDPLTLWSKIKESERYLFGEETAEDYTRLLSQRPQVEAYWNYMVQIVQSLRVPTKRATNERSGPLGQILSFLDKECELNNKYALVTRARIAPFLRRGTLAADARRDLNKAIAIDATYVEARVQRGVYWSHHGEYEKGIRDFRAAVRFSSRNYPVSRVRAQLSLARIYVKSMRTDLALALLAKILRDDPQNVEARYLRARALYFLGKYQRALDDMRRFLEVIHWDEVASLLPGQILAAMGDRAAAVIELSSLKTRYKSQLSRWNLAEAYLAVDPNQTLRLLDGAAAHEAGIPQTLRLLAKLLTGVAADDIRAELKISVIPQADVSWDPFETIALLRARRREKAIDQESFQVGLEIVSSTMRVDVRRAALERG